MLITAFSILRMHKRSALALAESEGRFHSFFDSAAVGFADVDPVTYRFRNVNAKMEELTGYSLAELKKITFTDLTHPDDRDQNFRDYKAVMGRKSPGQYTVEKRYIRKDGQPIWVLVTAVVQKSITGSGYQTSAVVQDITQRKRMEEETNRRRELLETLVQNAPVGVFIVSAPDMILELMNPAGQKIPPYNLKVGEYPFGHMAPEVREKLLARYRKVLETGVIDIEKNKLVGGDYYSVVRTRVRLPDGKAGVMTILHETSEQVTELRKAYAFLNALVENIPDVMFVKDAKDLRVTRVNKSWESFFGYTNEEVVGKNDHDLFPKEEADFFVSKDREVLTSGKLLDIPSESVHSRFKGKRILHTRKVPIFDEKGQPEYLLGLAEDVTEKKQAEEDRQNLLLEKVARIESERALKLRDEFISIAAHELKTPLTALNLQVQLLGRFLPQMESSKTSVFQNILRGSQEQLDRFSLLVDKLLDVSRASAGQLVLERAEENLSEIVLRVVKKYESELDRAHCSLELHLESFLTGFWDGTRVEQVVVNLLSNAMKYGAGRPIEVTTLSQGDTAILKVKDRGIGIAVEDSSRIFDRFERAVSTRSFGGFGLGLFISRQIAIAHGGSIRVESQLGSGSCFVVELPRFVQAQLTAST